MLVKDRMTPEPICGRSGMAVTEAQALMQEHKIRHLPIVDEAGELIGLVTQRSLLKALPADVRHFSRLEVGFVLAKIKVRDVMVTKVITTEGAVAIEEAARIMADRRLGCLPVLDDGRLVGIITDNDLFAIMVDLLGARRQGVRITVLQPDRAGEVARITTAIARHQGYLSAYVTYPAKQPGSWASVLKVSNLSPEVVLEALGELEAVEVQDVRVADVKPKAIEES